MRPAVSILLLSLFAAGATHAGPLRDLLALPQGVKVTRDLSYGPDRAQRIDVYTAQSLPHDAPVIVMVHGGGWKRGDKSMQSVVENKVARWVPRGFVFVSVNYRMLPEADVLAQAADVARALAYVQGHSAEWGGNGRQLILMGHSAGAHLVSLLTSSPQLARDNGLQSWLGTVALDSAALNVEAIMRKPHFGLYDEAFGADATYWRLVSPFAQVAGPTPPMLAVCSSWRASSCEQAYAYVQKTSSFGNRAQVQAENLSHRDINARLGLPGAYTDAVERFMRAWGRRWLHCWCLERLLLHPSGPRPQTRSIDRKV